MNVFTIGYGGRSQDEFLALLKANGMRTVVDIRLRPDRASRDIWAKARTADKGIEGGSVANFSQIGYQGVHCSTLLP